MIFSNIGNVEKDLFDETLEYHSDIPGLASRAKNHLEFLGLYNAQHRASKRHDIPAIRVRNVDRERYSSTSLDLLCMFVVVLGRYQEKRASSKY